MPSPSSITLGGSISLPQLCALTGWSAGRARLVAEKHAGPARSKRGEGGRLLLWWPLPALADHLAAHGPEGILPGGWCTRNFAATALRDLPAATRHQLLVESSPLLRHKNASSKRGTPCRAYALADLLAILRAPGALLHH